ncbi:MAG: carbohydrate ABC transporter permease [Chloroflexi bacterium]|nr:carbohydrate ABC transporter permease [Chloroflexota bacterium]
MRWRGMPAKLLICVLLVIEIYPLFWLLSTSLKSTQEFLNTPFWSLPRSLDFQNYADAWTLGRIGTSLQNSLTVTIPSVVLILLLGAAAGFALEVMVWKGRNWVLLAILGGIMVPVQMILLPLFTIYFKIGLTNTLWPLVLTYVGHGLPLTTFLMAAYFRGVPRELFESATLDGAGILRSFWTVGLPLVRNGLLTVALLMFFSTYNDLLIALTFITAKDRSTVQVGLLNFQGEYGTVLYGPLFAGICMTVLGTLVVYLLLSRQIMQGLAGGALKG